MPGYVPGTQLLFQLLEVERARQRQLRAMEVENARLRVRRDVEVERKNDEIDAAFSEMMGAFQRTYHGPYY